MKLRHVPPYYVGYSELRETVRDFLHRWDDPERYRRLPAVTDLREALAGTTPTCTCQASCEPHVHKNNGEILCLHDEEHNHSHCPNTI